MSDDELLERAARALRADTSPSREELAAGKRRLLEAHRKSHQTRRASTLRWVLPLAAALLTGSALAHTTGQLEKVTDAIVELFAPERAAQPASKARRAAARPRRAPAGKPPPLPAPLVEPAVASPLEENARVEASEPVGAEAPVASRSASPRPRTGRTPRSSERPASLAPEPSAQASDTPVGEAPASAPSPSADLASYRSAHDAHFKHADYAAALSRWDDYLRAHPHGMFSIEARYNRAICLLRLHRTEEARRALRPFARGEIERAYRQREASELLEALD